MFVLCEHMTATDCSTATGCSTGDVDILLHSPHTPHSHMEAIKHHYLNIDIEQRLYLAFRKHSDDNWQVMAWLVLVASVCLSFSTSKLQFVMKVKFHTGQAFKLSLPRYTPQPPAQSLRTHINQNWQVTPSGLLGTSKIVIFCPTKQI